MENRKKYQTDLTDKQWEEIEQLFIIASGKNANW